MYPKKNINDDTSLNTSTAETYGCNFHSNSTRHV